MLILFQYILYSYFIIFYFLNDPPTTEIYTLSLHDALPIFAEQRPFVVKAPLVVLIDGDSGSGSEILAAAFKEYQLAALVGQKTAGAVGSANTRPRSDGST